MAHLNPELLTHSLIASCLVIPRSESSLLSIEMSGPKCCENPPTLDPSAGVGSVVELGGLNSYVTGSSNSKLAIILASDVFGYEAPNLRKIADKVAANGYYVVVPDFFYGDPFVSGSQSIDDWLQEHGTDKGFEDAKSVIAALKSKGISSIGAAGYCWGAKPVVQLAQSKDYIEAAVLLHPSFVTVDDIKEVKVPIAILGAELDQLTSPEIIKEFEEILSSQSEVDYFVKIFPGVDHGWTIRYNDEDENAVQSAEEAYQDMLNWFIKNIKN
nr:endo-1,3;1,4-beta-D-glucanase-like [Ipomoea batatas]